LLFIGTSQTPESEPRVGWANNLFDVVGSAKAVSYVLGGVASSAGAFDDQPCDVNFFMASSVSADFNKVW
jgi:hypothetical protein